MRTIGLFGLRKPCLRRAAAWLPHSTAINNSSAVSFLGRTWSPRLFAPLREMIECPFGDRSLTNIQLTAEEEFLWDCARLWQTPNQLRYSQGIDWAKVVATGRHNRMQTLLQQICLSTDLIDKL